MSALGQKIKEERERRGLTQSQLAEMLGSKSYQLIQRWESGRGKPTTTQLPLIAQVLELQVLELLDLANETKETKLMVQANIRTQVKKSTGRLVNISYIPYIEDVERAFPVRSELIKPGVSYGIVTIADKAMEPQLQTDSTVLAKQIAASEMPLETGGVYAIRSGDRLTVRRVHANELRSGNKLTLHPDNENYELLTLKADQVQGMWLILSILDQPVH